MIRSLLLCFTLSITSFAALADTLPSTETAEVSEQRTAWQPRGGEQVRFEVLRKGRPFGYHNIDFKRLEDGSLEVMNDVHFRVSVGPLTLFNYRHESVEKWRDGTLTFLEGMTRKSGKDFVVSAEATNNGIEVDGTLNMGVEAGDLVPFSHWNIAQVDDQFLLSSESGELIPISVEPIARETIEVDGVELPATRYRMTSELVADLWYDDEGRWLKFAFEARGQQIEYRLTHLY